MSDNPFHVTPTGSAPVHVTPVGDLMEHDLSDDCACGPRTDPVERDDGSFGWVIVHHSLDGREAAEAAD